MIFRFGTYEIDSGRYELRRDCEPVAVEPKVLDLLALLVHHAEGGDLARSQDLAHEVLRINPELSAKLALCIDPFALRKPGVLDAFRSAGLP